VKIENKNVEIQDFIAKTMAKPQNINKNKMNIRNYKRKKLYTCTVLLNSSGQGNCK